MILGLTQAYAVEPTLSYDEMKANAVNFENALSEKEKSNLNLAYATPLLESFAHCLQFARATTFEIISWVDEKGTMTQNWTNTQGVFAACMSDQFQGRYLYPINQKPYYAILNFDLTTTEIDDTPENPL